MVSLALGFFGREPRLTTIKSVILSFAHSHF